MEKLTKRDESISSLDPHKLRILLTDLVDIYSPSGKEGEILDYLYQYLRNYDIPVRRQHIDENRYNLIVAPSDDENQIALIGHVDTVTAYDLDSYQSEEQGNIIYGLGTADMKSGCAAMVEAYVHAWKATNGSLPAALALVVGEEEEGDGARTLVQDYHFPWIIIGEPTELQPCFNHYGYVEIQLTTEGERMHASLANKKQNPVETMLRILLELTEHMTRTWPDLVYNIRDLFSPPGGFVVPEYCEVWIDTHLPPNAPIGKITLELEEVVDSYQLENPGTDICLRFTTIHAGYDIPVKGSLVETLRTTFCSQSLPWLPQSFRSHSDANTLWEAGMKPIILGPGRIDQAHAPEESIDFQQVNLASKLYFDLLMTLKSA